MTVDLEKKLVRSSIQIHEDKSQDQFRTHFDFILPYGFSSTNDKLIRDLQAVKDKTARVTEWHSTRSTRDGRRACS